MLHLNGPRAKMDPTESIFSSFNLLDDLNEDLPSFCSFGQNFGFSSSFSFDDNLNNFIDYFENDYLSNSPSFLNDHFLNTFDDHHFNLLDTATNTSVNSVSLNQHSYAQQQINQSSLLNSSSVVSSVNHRSNLNQQQQHQHQINYNKQCETRIKATVSTSKLPITPKVYVSKQIRSKDQTKRLGTSILIKQNNGRRRFNNKNGSILMSKKTAQAKSSLISATSTINDVIGDNTFNQLEFLENYYLKDHDYCITIDTTATNSKTCSSTNTSKVKTSTTNESQDKLNKTNELDDILQGYCTDDVMLKELPECLSSLIGLSSSSKDFISPSISSEDLLNGLTDVCNFMTDQFIEENLMDNVNLPNLDLTEEVMAEVTKQSIHDIESTQFDSKIHTKCGDESDVEMNKSKHTNTVVDLNKERADDFDASSEATGFTDESTSTIEKPERKRKTSFSKISKSRSKSKQFKRNRSFSSSSTNGTILVKSKRRRRFSTRSSINSSDSMSDDSSMVESSISSRQSSPERAFCHNFVSTSDKTPNNDDDFKPKHQHRRYAKCYRNLHNFVSFNK